jgi:hypothetical protein
MACYRRPYPSDKLSLQVLVRMKQTLFFYSLFRESRESLARTICCCLSYLDESSSVVKSNHVSGKAGATRTVARQRSDARIKSMYDLGARILTPIDPCRPTILVKTFAVADY